MMLFRICWAKLDSLKLLSHFCFGMMPRWVTRAACCTRATHAGPSWTSSLRPEGRGAVSRGRGSNPGLRHLPVSQSTPSFSSSFTVLLGRLRAFVTAIAGPWSKPLVTSPGWGSGFYVQGHFYLLVLFSNVLALDPSVVYLFLNEKW